MKEPRKWPCPFCGRPGGTYDPWGNNASSTPTVGAASLCVGCEQWGVFDGPSSDDMVLRKPTADEARSLALDEDAQAAKASVAFAKIATDYRPGHPRRWEIFE